MSEEIQDAAINVPRAMVYSTLVNGILALAMLITFLFCAGEISDAESSSPYPFVPIFARLVGSDSGAIAMASLVVILQFCSCIAATATASRMTWSFARDHGLPSWKALSRVCRNSSSRYTLISVDQSTYDYTIDCTRGRNDTCGAYRTNQHRKHDCVQRRGILGPCKSLWYLCISVQLVIISTHSWGHWTR